jgi:hypothetical protein
MPCEAQHTIKATSHTNSSIAQTSSITSVYTCRGIHFAQEPHNIVNFDCGIMRNDTLQGTSQDYI